jgi:hypothetical protein
MGREGDLFIHGSKISRRTSLQPAFSLGREPDLRVSSRIKPIQPPMDADIKLETENGQD